MRTRLAALVLSCALALGCASAPVHLSPVATADFYKTRVIQSLDVLRDTAISANAQTPALVSTATTRTIVTYHESALKIISVSAAGWQMTVSVTLDEAVKDLPATESKTLAPYVALIKAVLMEIQ